MTKAGQLISDGGVTWIVDDVRDGARVGDIILRPALRDGYIKANGATVKASEYPRLLAWVQEAGMTVTAEQYAQDCSKYVYDRAADTLTLPNAVGRVLQGGETVKSVEAGLPNITGHFTIRGPSETGLLLADASVDGAIRNTIAQSANKVGSSGGWRAYSSDYSLDASRSNPIYGRSDTVQPPAITMIAQIKY